MKILKVLCIGTAYLILFVIFSGKALAIPMAEISYLETDLGDGTFQYDYTVTNASDPDEDAGFDLYAVLFTYDSAVSLTGVLLPSDWFWSPSDVDFFYGDVFTFSTLPGPPPFGMDIAPGMSLSGFSFWFDGQVGDSLFEATFSNPTYPFDPVIISGTTAPVPEPATILLLITGMVGMGVFGRKKLRN